VGTELASVLNPTGGLERVVQLWSIGLANRGHRVLLIDRRPSEQPPRSPRDGGAAVLAATDDDLGPLLDAHGVDVVVCNNRPFTQVGQRPRVDCFHNYPRGWDASGTVDGQALHHQLLTTTPTAVSTALANHIVTTFALPDGSVATTPPPIDPIFAATTHRGGAGILFPNRLMEKKGVRVTLAALDRAGLTERATFLDYTTPFLRTSPEFLDLRRCIVEAGATLAPPCTPEQLAQRYADADLVIAVATEPEGLGLVPLEAQVVGAPLVTAGPGGLAEATFAPNVHCATSDVDELARAITNRLGAADVPAQPVVLERYGVEGATTHLEAAIARARATQGA
jgi:glycosyltransferase involved in cell wall biosynthesis